MDHTILPTPDIINHTAAAINERNVDVQVVATKQDALEAVKQLIPAGAKIMTGSSTTLDQIGFIDLLKSKDHPWNNLKDAIIAEKDPAKQAVLRKQSIVDAEYFLGSVHAVTQDGELVVASASGSQLPAYTFTTDNIIWVVGAQKIVPSRQDAFVRIKEHVVPLEDQRMKSTGAPGTNWAHTYIFSRNIMPRKLHLILVQEVLGF